MIMEKLIEVDEKIDRRDEEIDGSCKATSMEKLNRMRKLIDEVEEIDGKID
jgi:hypothetical protein